MTLERLAQRFHEFGSTTRAPLYQRLSLGVAAQPSLASALLEAPVEQQLPVLFLAAVHYLLLTGVEHPLRAHYPNLVDQASTADPMPALTDFCQHYGPDIAALVGVRSTQTNEVGRCSLFLPALAMVADECGDLVHIDMGTSAGLNLLLPRYGYRYTPGVTVNADASLVLDCATRGAVPSLTQLPSIARSIGVDLSPIDVHDENETRWLEACVWPDDTARFTRLVAAIGMARDATLDIRQGDAVDMLEPTVLDAARSGHPVITNSWVLNYLPYERRCDYLATLDRLGEDLDLSWVLAEAPAQTAGIPIPTHAEPEEITVLALVRWRRGVRTVQRLATCHPHGAWLHWEL